MLKEVKRGYEKQVASVLKWLVYSLRPLYLDEVAEIFILDPDKPVPFDDDDRVFDVLDYLPGMVTKVHVDDQWDGQLYEIRFSHFSIKEYLMSTRISNKIFSTPEEVSHLHISECCLAYHLQLSKTIQADEDTVEKYVLWEYIALRCVAHMEQVPLKAWTASLKDRATQIFTASSQPLHNMIRICDPYYGYRKWDVQQQDLAPPLFYSTLYDARNLSTLLIENGADVEECWLPNDSYPDRYRSAYATPLQVAAYRGNKVSAKLLIEKGANVNAQGELYYYNNALNTATCFGNLELVRLLLESGAEVSAQGGECGNALHAATYSRDLEIVQLLLNSGAEVNAKGGKYGNALQAAVSAGDLEIAHLLLESGAEVNAKGCRFGNAIQAAILMDQMGLAELLLSRGATCLTPERSGTSGWQNSEQNIVRKRSLYASLETIPKDISNGGDNRSQDGKERNGNELSRNCGWTD